MDLAGVSGFEPEISCSAGKCLIQARLHAQLHSFLFVSPLSASIVVCFSVSKAELGTLIVSFVIICYLLG